MLFTVIIYTQNENKLKQTLELIKTKVDKKKTKILIHSNGYEPWKNQDILNEITTFQEYSAYRVEKEIINSILDLVYSTKTDYILILDENCQDFTLTNWKHNDFKSLYCNKNDLLRLNLDTKYKTLKWFIIDVLSQALSTEFNIEEVSEDNSRYQSKISSYLFNQKIIYIDGGIGDHVLALPLVQKLSKTSFICCKYEFVFEHLPNKGFINWNDYLFGGYIRNVYEYGSRNNSKSIIEAFFGLYGMYREPQDSFKYTGTKDSSIDILTDKKIALICTSAAKINDQDSNKDWKEIRWLKLVNFLQKSNYFVVQVGSINDNQIPNVDYKFLDKPISQLSYLIHKSSIWLSVDTFFHHFASSIKPEVGICLTPFYNDHAKHYLVKYIEKDCGKNFSDRKWWLDLQQPERKECMDLIQLEDVTEVIKNIQKK